MLNNRSKIVDWSKYASVYDMILDHNPAYQELLEIFKDDVFKWDLQKDHSLLDVGAGTGNFTKILAETFPYNQILHIDSSEDMKRAAEEKIGKDNVTFAVTSIENVSWNKLPKLGGIVCTHALYTFANQKSYLKVFYDALQPGGYLFLCDVGKKLDIADWTLFFIKNLLKTQGVIGTCEIMWKGREVLKQNSIIKKMQSRGDYWLHSLLQLKDLTESAGFKILKTLNTFRGYSNLIVARKPKEVSKE